MQNKSLLLLIAIFIFGCGQVFASGFAIIEQSVSGLGTAFSGGAASADDPSTVFFNPAGMMLLEGQQATAGVHYIMPSVKFKTEKAESTMLPDGSGGYMTIPLGSDNGGQAGITKIVPNLYYSNRVSDKLAFGLGINAPFGLSTEYDKTWVGRYHAVESEVVTININPSVAFQVTEKLSIGAGFNAQYMEATLSSMVDGGLVGVKAGAAITPSQTANDVYVKNNADDWGYGYNLGLIYAFTPKNRLGLHYRSEIKHKLEGDVKVDVPASLYTTTFTHPLYGDIPLASLFSNQDINGTIILPATASVSYFHQLTDKLAVMADVTWTEWSSFDKLTINFEGAGIAGNSSTTTTEKWDDTWRYSIGATFQASDDLLLRIGTAYDETPISDKYRTPRIPGEDRIWLSLGAGYKVLDHLMVDVAYTHLFVKDSKMEKSASDPEDASRGTVVGEFENAVDIASIQLTYTF